MATPRLRFLRQHFLHVEVPVTLAIWWILRDRGYVADIPWWVFAGLLVLALVVGSLATQLFPPSRSRTDLWLRIALLTAVITATMYATGWGPMLVIGYGFLVGENLEDVGSKASMPAFVCATIATVIGQVLIQAGVVYCFVAPPVIHGLAVLELLGLAIVVRVMHKTALQKEAAEQEVRGREQRFRALLANATDIIVVFDPDGHTSYVSPAFERILGYESAAVFQLGDELVHPEDLPKMHDAFATSLLNPGESVWLEARLCDAGGDWHSFEIGIRNLLDDPSVAGMVGNLRDVTERRLFEQQLEYQARTDALTQLPNRRAFLERLDISLRQAAADDQSVAVLFLDVDRFKLVNDSLGHEVGDRLLVEIARRLRDTLRPGDTVARFGGDEFTVLLEDIRSARDAVAVADRIDRAVREPILVGGRELVCTSSVGIAVAMGGDSQPDDLLREADLAMYMAKEKGRSCYEVYDEFSQPAMIERLELEADLWHAVDSDALSVHFQPDVALADHRIVTLEALVRWEHPTRGMLAPDAFVPFAEESNLILAIDRFVLREACVRVVEWEALPGMHDDMRISVNLSPRFVRQSEAVDEVVAVLRETGADPRRLQLEITERIALVDDAATVETLRQLRNLGVAIAIDDFGTGYSSLGYLKQFPIDVLKLDKSFVDALESGPSDQAIAQAVITMGHAMGMRVTAEGVEHAEQATTLRGLGCDSAQGFHFAAALSPVEVTRLLQDPEPIFEGRVLQFTRRSIDAG